jgi:hypothetical protein
LLGNNLERNKPASTAKGKQLLTSKYTQPLLGNVFAYRHVPMKTIDTKMNGVYYAVRVEML